MLTVPDIAKRLNCSPSLIYLLVSEGRLCCYRIGSRRGTIRFSEEQLQAFLKSCEVSPLAAVAEGLKHIRLPS